MFETVVNGLMTIVALVAGLAAKDTVNSTCNLIVYEPKMPKAAEKLVK